MRHAQAFIFDLDGTLIDSLQDITDALNAALFQLGRRGAEPSQVRRWIGDGLLMLCKRAGGADEAVVEELSRLTAARYAEHCADHTRPYHNILKMLDLLRERGTRLAVLSNKPHAATVDLVMRLGLNGYFAVIRGCKREEEKKPSPGAALEIAETLQIQPRGIFLVGDSPMDVETARNAGMTAVAVTWGFRDRDELEAARPDYLFENPMQILSLVEQ